MRPESTRRRERQIEFGPLQTHPRSFEVALVVLNVVLVVIVIILVLTVDGPFIGPWG